MSEREHATKGLTCWCSPRVESYGDEEEEDELERLLDQRDDLQADVAKLRATGDDLAGLLLMVLDNQIRCGWVAEGSPFLDEPRRALERWHALVLEGVGGAEPMSVDERDREVLEEARRIYGLSPAANDWLAKARENLERAARFAEYSGPAALIRQTRPATLTERSMARMAVRHEVDPLTGRLTGRRYVRPEMIAVWERYGLDPAPFVRMMLKIDAEDDKGTDSC